MNKDGHSDTCIIIITFLCSGVEIVLFLGDGECFILNG